MNAISCQSILRYQPKDGSAHSTAIMLEDSLLEVKREGNTVKNPYPSVELWLLSIPGATWADVTVSPSGKTKHATDNMEDRKEVEVEVEVEDREEKPEKGKKKGKTAVEKVKLRLIPIKDRIYSIMWTHHLHRLMKEANPALLKREDVIRAFNRLVEVLLEHQSHVYTIHPSTNDKYKEETILPNIMKPHKELYYVCRIHMNCVIHNAQTGRTAIRDRYYYCADVSPTEEEQRISKQILDAYLPLLDLIREDILPYMRHRYAQTENKRLDKLIDGLVNGMEKKQSQFENELERRKQAIQSMIASHEKKMTSFRDSIARLASQKIDDAPKDK